MLEFFLMKSFGHWVIGSSTLCKPLLRSPRPSHGEWSRRRYRARRRRPRRIPHSASLGLGATADLLHDGRTVDLLQAIQAHSSSGSEANQVIDYFNGLSSAQKQHILNFLRSL